MKILHVASEAVPFIKTGGLADVIGSLPVELKKQGVDVRVVLPKYKDIPVKFTEQMKWIKSIDVPVGWRNQFCGIEELELDGVKYYFLDNRYYFGRDGLYGFVDDGERFSFFCKAVVEFLQHVDFIPDIVHCHDWHSGMVPLILTEKKSIEPLYSDVKTVFTVHNLKFQGVFPKEVLTDLLQISDLYFNLDGVEFYNNISFMKGGINFSHVFNTVSPTYAQEIKHPFFGEKLEGLICYRHEKLRGILNGLDYAKYNPAVDPLIFENYSLDTIEKKYTNKMVLQTELGLPHRREVPVIAIVSRLTEQKGLPLVEGVISEMLGMDVQFIILGTGDKKYEELFHRAQEQFPHKISFSNTFNEGLAQKIYAGSDIYLMPSLFEPCGLSQLIALRYGTIPVVRETGGLKDTVTPYNKYTGEGNGFSFENYNAHEMLYTIERAVNIYYNEKHIWYHLIKNAMESDFSWEKSAKVYLEMYKEIL
ncbi:glycogen synthase GlgA [Alkalicella caledoniensis]|uniref:Glycogen synthase n=1 Tax=Alkalicella caledoniensis TaxID=2731377 RepID=A0A7G9WD31_ALKCA|nr:glycogen synthase GlgA [Alkalicella caledoniensis]QNO16593.1 glycogen synthase GlgA [Alkalicella caledoniensis]